MKVAMIGSKGIPSRAGGVEIHVEELAAGLAKKGVTVDVYCRKSYCDKIDKNYRGVNLIYIPSINTKHLDAITYTFFATIIALFKNYDVLHYHALGPSSMIWLPKLFGRNIVCTVHGLDWKRKKWGKIGKLYLKLGEKMIAKYASKIIVLSESMKNYFKDTWDRESVVIPNGVYCNEKIEANIIKKKYNLKMKSYILFLARLVPEKGAHYLIEAFKQINTDKLLVIAGGSSHTDDYVKKLKKLASGCNNIKFTGFVKGDELKELYSNAYLYVLPSEIEGLPISLLEAFSFGECCLVSDIIENKEVVKNDTFTFKSKDVTSLKEKLVYLLNNEAIVRKSGEDNIKEVLRNYNWGSIVENTFNEYEQYMLSNHIQEKNM